MNINQNYKNQNYSNIKYKNQNYKNENYKKCSICNKYIELNQYYIHKNNCNSQLVLNPNHQMLMNYQDVIINFLQKYNELFKNFIENKTIALVGPAESIIGTKKGHIIDNFDIVIRLNKSLPLPENLAEDIGTKTSILYNSLNTSDFPGENKFQSSFLQKHNIQFLCCPYPIENNYFKNDILNYVKRNKFGMPFRVIKNQLYNSIENSIRTRPYTGTCAICDLLSYNIKYLYITGLDFYTTKYYKQYRRINKQQLKNTRNNVYHKNEPQINLLRHMSLFDNRIILDSYLDGLLYENYYEVTKLLNKNKYPIFNFENPQLRDFFSLNMCNITYSILSNKKPNNDKPTVIFTNNKHVKKEQNTYLIYITPNINDITNLNKNLNEKKYIGNFFYKKQNTNQTILIYLNPMFINYVKKVLTKINIKNCNIHFLMFLSLIIYSRNHHYFDSNEILQNWGLNVEEKKYFLFLQKKKSFTELE